MNIDQLMALGGMAPIKYVVKTVEWEGNKFDVKIKSEETPADFEFIYARAMGGEDAYSARRVHRFVLLAGDQPIPYEKAVQLKPSLLLCLTNAINQVHKEKPKAEAKKPSRQRRSSGTN